MLGGFRRAAWLALLDLPCPDLLPYSSARRVDPSSAAEGTVSVSSDLSQKAARDHDNGEWHTVKRKRHTRRPSTTAPAPTSTPTPTPTSSSSSSFLPSPEIAGSTANSLNPPHGVVTAKSKHASRRSQRKRAQKTARRAQNCARICAAAKLPPHRDENQVTLDVRRSLISYCGAPPTLPLDLINVLRAIRQAQLYDVIVSVLRTHPELSYYQGYHEVVSVLLLTLVPPPSQDEMRSYLVHEANSTLPTIQTSSASEEIIFDGHCAPWSSPAAERSVKCAAARVSLHLLRDHHAPTLEPGLGHLHILRHSLIGDAAQLVSCASQEGNALPLFALAWPLTCFAHDLPSLALAQRMMDIFLAYGPRMLLTVSAVLLARRSQELASEHVKLTSDASVLHHALQQLPRLDADPSLVHLDAVCPTPSSIPARADSARNENVEPPGVGNPPLYLGSYQVPHPPEPVPLSTLLKYARDLSSKHDDPGAGEVTRVMQPGSVLLSWDSVLGPRARRTQGVPDSISNYMVAYPDPSKSREVEHTHQDTETTPVSSPMTWAERDAQAVRFVLDTGQIVQMERVLESMMTLPRADVDEFVEEADATENKAPGSSQGQLAVQKKYGSEPTSGSVLIGLATVAVGVVGVGIVLSQQYVFTRDAHDESLNWTQPFLVAAAEALHALSGGTRDQAT